MVHIRATVEEYHCERKRRAERKRCHGLFAHAFENRLFQPCFLTTALIVHPSRRLSINARDKLSVGERIGEVEKGTEQTSKPDAFFKQLREEGGREVKHWPRALSLSLFFCQMYCLAALCFSTHHHPDQDQGEKKREATALAR